MRKRKFWGWGYEDELLSDEEENNIDKKNSNNFCIFLFIYQKTSGQ